MKTIYMETIEAFTKNGSFKGLKFSDSNHDNKTYVDSHVYIDHRVIPLSKLDSMVTSGTVIKINSLSKDEIKLNESSIKITNGKNNQLGLANIETGFYRVKGGGGSLGENCSYTYAMAFLYSRVIDNQTKIYKIENIKVKL